MSQIHEIHNSYVLWIKDQVVHQTWPIEWATVLEPYMLVGWAEKWQLTWQKQIHLRHAYIKYMYVSCLYWQVAMPLMFTVATYHMYMSSVLHAYSSCILLTSYIVQLKCPYGYSQTPLEILCSCCWPSLWYVADIIYSYMDVWISALSCMVFMDEQYWYVFWNMINSEAKYHIYWFKCIYIENCLWYNYWEILW